MRVLVVGGGGREHALVDKIIQSPLIEKVYCAPGNAGIAQIAECVDFIDISTLDDFKLLAKFARKNKVDLTVVPEAPLAAGIVDYFQNYWDLKVFGPSQTGAQIEDSKGWAKNFMSRYKIPTAEYVITSSVDTAFQIVAHKGVPIVIKAGGLTAGKGSFVCQNFEETTQAIERIMLYREWGHAGDTVVIEEFLEGEEATFTALSDGKIVLPLVTSQDHKKVFEEDHLAPNPNTGGICWAYDNRRWSKGFGVQLPVWGSGGTSDFAAFEK